MSRIRFSRIVLCLALGAGAAQAGALARLVRNAPALPDGARVQRDLSYGADPAQAMDVYSMPGGANRPIILMIHGGAWAAGDKVNRGVVEAKLAHWLPRGTVFVSANYRMLPAQDVSGQADDVARALAFVQQHARAWGGDPARVTLMGHSAGAHLVALLSADPARAQALGARRWNATIALDSAALDVASIMQRRHLGLYDRAFGADPAAWRRLSPLQAMRPGAVPVLAVCSTQRRDNPCAQAQEYTARAKQLGIGGAVLPEDLDHAGINRELGAEENYTAAVDRFIAEHGGGGGPANAR
jgi:acetyl esterase/lipase